VSISRLEGRRAVPEEKDRYSGGGKREKGERGLYSNLAKRGESLRCSRVEGGGGSKGERKTLSGLRLKREKRFSLRGSASRGGGRKKKERLSTISASLKEGAAFFIIAKEGRQTTLIQGEGGSFLSTREKRKGVIRLEVARGGRRQFGLKKKSGGKRGKFALVETASAFFFQNRGRGESDVARRGGKGKAREILASVIYQKKESIFSMKKK